MIKFDIKNRFTGNVQFTAEIDCSDDETKSIKFGLAVKWALKNKADLEGADLEGADLRGADLRGADLRGADLEGACLRGACLRGAYLEGADLEGADLEGADLEGADLRGAYLEGADLEGADLRGACLRGADLEGADLRGADLRGADLEGADLRGACLRGADLEGANLEDGPVIENIHQKVHEAVKAGEALDMSEWHNDCGTKHCRAGWVVALAGKEGKKLEEKIGTPAAAYVIYRLSDPEIKAMPDFYCSDEEAMEDITACAEREKNKPALSKGEAQ